MSLKTIVSLVCVIAISSSIAKPYLDKAMRFADDVHAIREFFEKESPEWKSIGREGVTAVKEFRLRFRGPDGGAAMGEEIR